MEPEKFSSRNPEDYVPPATDWRRAASLELEVQSLKERAGPERASRLVPKDVLVFAVVLCFPCRGSGIDAALSKKIVAKVSFLRRPNIEQSPSRDRSSQLRDSAAKEACHGKRR
jgi:hypothetical protein